METSCDLGLLRHIDLAGQEIGQRAGIERERIVVLKRALLKGDVRRDLEVGYTFGINTVSPERRTRKRTPGHPCFCTGNLVAPDRPEISHPKAITHPGRVTRQLGCGATLRACFDKG